MHRLMLHNQEIRDVSDLTLSAGQTGLMNGWGVFSTIRIYDGVLFAWERHFARMRHDAQRMRVPFPADPVALEEQLHRLIEVLRSEDMSQARLQRMLRRLGHHLRHLAEEAALGALVGAGEAKRASP